jgi:hypothetical protein
MQGFGFIQFPPAYPVNTHDPDRKQTLHETHKKRLAHKAFEEATRRGEEDSLLMASSPKSSEMHHDLHDEDIQGDEDEEEEEDIEEESFTICCCIHIREETRNARVLTHVLIFILSIAVLWTGKMAVTDTKDWAVGDMHIGVQASVSWACFIFFLFLMVSSIITLPAWAIPPQAAGGLREGIREAEAHKVFDSSDGFNLRLRKTLANQASSFSELEKSVKRSQQLMEELRAQRQMQKSRKL